MLRACSHLVLATDDVPRITRFFQEAFGLKPYFENDMFSEFVLPSQHRIAFFKPVGASAKTFSTQGSRTTASFGVTVENVEAFFHHVQPRLSAWSATVSGSPKDHPWGEKSFLLTDPDGNRWEITQSPTQSGMLVNRP